VLLGDKGGEVPRLAEGEVALAIWELEVAWCLKLGGALAIVLALARLAAIAAATLLFLLFFGVEGAEGATAWGLGHAFSSCLRAMGSRESIMTLPRSCHTSSKTQKHTRALSFTVGLASARAFFSDFSKKSRLPEDSMMCFERWPWTSR